VVIPRLLIYIPTRGRSDLALQQVAEASRQRHQLPGTLSVRIMVSVNADPSYDHSAFLSAGADALVTHSTDIGGDANYCMGLAQLGQCDYLWVLSDDDALLAEGLFTIADIIHETSPDLICLSWGSEAWSLADPQDVHQLERKGAVVPLISASIFRARAFECHVVGAFQAIFTHFPQVALIRSAIESGDCHHVVGVCLDQVIDYQHAVRYLRGVTRREIGASHGALFFGGALLNAWGTSVSLSRSEGRRWWRRHWHQASLFRRSDSVEGDLADALARGRAGTLVLYMCSLPPWWRIKDALTHRRIGRWLNHRRHS